MTAIEIERARCREKYYRLYRKTKIAYKDRRSSEINYRKKYPEKYSAGKAIRNRNRKAGIDFHHWSYNPDHYQDTVELKKMDHYKAHRYLVYDQERMMYRTVKGILLDTKSKHVRYIKNKITYAQ